MAFNQKVFTISTFSKIQQNGIQHKDIRHNGIQHEDMQHNDIQNNGIQLNDSKHSSKKEAHFTTQM